MKSSMVISSLLISSLALSAVVVMTAACGDASATTDRGTPAPVQQSSPSPGATSMTDATGQQPSGKTQPAATPSGRESPDGSGVGSTAVAGGPGGCPTTPLACRIADDFARYLRFSDFTSMFRNVEATPIVCPGPVEAGIEPAQPLCSGAPAGQLRNGFPIALHGSEGQTVSGTDLPERVKTAVGDPTHLRLIGIGCDGSSDCVRFVVVFATGGTPQVVYFTFNARPVPGVPLSARLSGFGLSGDNAPDILSFKPAQTGIGLTSFVAYAGAR